MGFMDDIVAAKQTRQRRTLIDQALKDLDGADSADLVAALVDPMVAASQIAAALGKRGFTVSTSTVRGWRGKLRQWVS